eukprot:COSAG01_NODE_12364_length_1752_cov_1.782214_2_plen_54_part_00
MFEQVFDMPPAAAAGGGGQQQRAPQGGNGGCINTMHATLSAHGRMDGTWNQGR